MGLLRLMGNKADVVKGLAKRCNENWRVAPTSDIVCILLVSLLHIDVHICIQKLTFDVLYRACIYPTSKTT